MRGKLKDCTGRAFRQDACKIVKSFSDGTDIYAKRAPFVSCMQDAGRARSVRMPRVTEEILPRVGYRPECSTLAIAEDVHVPQSTV